MREEAKVFHRPKLREMISPSQDVLYPDVTNPAPEPSIREEIARMEQPVPIRESSEDVHVPGGACAEHFRRMLPDPQHMVKLEALMENEGTSLEQAILAHLIAALSSPMTITPFAEEAGELVRQKVGIPTIKICPGCGYEFTPERGNQQCCCNPCGSRMRGGNPLRAHAEDCSVVS